MTHEFQCTWRDRRFPTTRGVRVLVKVASMYSMKPLRHVVTASEEARRVCVQGEGRRPRGKNTRGVRTTQQRVAGGVIRWRSRGVVSGTIEVRTAKNTNRVCVYVKRGVTQHGTVHVVRAAAAQDYRGGMTSSGQDIDINRGRV